MRPDRLVLNDIMNAADEIADFLLGANLQSFAEDNMLRGAVMHLLMVIGEATAILSDDLKSRYPVVDWSRVKGFRNVAIHQYFKIDWERVWFAASIEAPDLRHAVAEIARREFGDEPGMENSVS